MQNVYMHMDTETKYAYLAGIIDGEGHFQGSDRSHGQGIRVSVIDEELIDWLCENFPGTNRYRGTITSAGNQVYTWFAEKRSVVREILLGILPYLVIKRKQAEAMLELIEHLLNKPSYEVPTARVSAAERNRRREVRAAHKARAQELRSVLPALRKRGVHDDE